MASLLDIGLVGFLTPLFVFILVFAILYALISKTKFFGDNAGLNLIISFTVAILFFVMPEARMVVSLYTPWVVLLTIMIVFIIMFFMFLGVKESTISWLARENPTFMTFIIATLLILFLVAMVQAFGPFLTTNQEPGFWNAVKRTIFHPRTLGALFLLVVASYTIHYMTSK